MFAITIAEKGGETKRLEFDKVEVTIGRVQGNDVVLPKGNVSKRHSRIVLKDGKYIVVDLKSTNGTYVNGRKITSPIVIKGSDKVYIGDFVITIDEPAVASDQSDLPPPLPPPSRRVSEPPPPPRRSGPDQVTGGLAAVDANGQPLAEPPPLGPADDGEAIGPPPGEDVEEVDSPLTVGVSPPGVPPRTTRPLTAATGPVAPARPAFGRGPQPPEPAPVRPPQAHTIMRPPPAVLPPGRERIPSQPVVPAVRPGAFPPPSDPVFPVPSTPSAGPIVPPAPAEAIPPMPSQGGGTGGGPDRAPAVAALASLVERLGAELQASGVHSPGQAVSADTRRQARQAAARLAGDAGVGLPAEALAQAAVAELLGAGPLDALLDDPAVEVVRVARHDRLLVERGGERTLSERFFSSPAAVARAVLQLSGEAPSGGVVTARLASGHELVALLPPAVAEPSLLVRRARAGASLAGLVSGGALSRGMADALSLAVRSRCGIVVAGEAPTGREALVAALLREGDPTDGVVALGEGGAPGAARVPVAGPSGAREALAAALRLEPDRLVVGPGAAAVALEALLALPGTLVAVAATSGADAVGRLLAQARLANPGADGDALGEALAAQAQVVVTLARDADGRPLVARIAEIEHFDARGRAQLADLFVQSGDGTFSATGRVPAFAEGAGAALFKN